MDSSFSAQASQSRAICSKSASVARPRSTAFCDIPPLRMRDAAVLAVDMISCGTNRRWDGHGRLLTPHALVLGRGKHPRAKARRDLGPPHACLHGPVDELRARSGSP